MLEKPLGMSIGGDQKNGIIVTKLKPGSTAEKSGKIKPGYVRARMCVCVCGHLSGYVCGRIESARRLRHLHGLLWYGMAWYGMVWYGMVWHDMVWYAMLW